MITDNDPEVASVKADNLRREVDEAKAFARTAMNPSDSECAEVRNFETKERICYVKKGLAFWLTEDGTIGVDTPGPLQEMDKKQTEKVMQFFLDAIQGRIVHRSGERLK
jgi:hypothetical protein